MTDVNVSLPPALLRGLEVLPRKPTEYKGRTLLEFDPFDRHDAVRAERKGASPIRVIGALRRLPRRVGGQAVTTTFGSTRRTA